MPLPNALAPEQLALAEMPPDLTLAEAASFIITTDSWAAFEAAWGKLTLRFVDAEGVEAPGTMTLGEFRKIPGATIAIGSDDGGGGVRVPERVE